MRDDRHFPGSIAFKMEASGEIGERIIAYLNQIGRVEGTVARHFYGGFAIQMKLRTPWRKKLADQLTSLTDPQVPRHTPRDPPATSTSTAQQGHKH